ncbi:TPA: hypothetical protein ACRL96_003354, partial [Pseudomonas aeruginosa]
MIALSSLIDVNAESRFFLQALMLRKPDWLGAPYEIKSVAKELCLTERFARDASRELIRAGLLIENKQHGGLGRPGVGYVASEYVRRVLCEVDRDLAHHELIVRLFLEPNIYATGLEATSTSIAQKEKSSRPAIRKDGRPAAPGAKGRLGAASRVLLAALLSEADKCGVVAELSGRKLREMTGLDSSSIKHQLNRLLSLGFLRSYVPGVSNGVLVGSKTMSIYYLNLDHPQLPVRQGKQERGLVVYAVKGPQKYDLVEAALPSTVQLAGVDNQVKEMLYHRLASHASQLLTALWSDPKCDIADLKAAGFESVGGKSIEPLTVSPEPSEPDRWSDFKESLHAEACRWAESIYKGLRRMNVWPEYSPQLVRLIPAPDAGDGWSVVSLIVYPAPKASNTCLWVWDVRGGRSDPYVGEEA